MHVLIVEDEPLLAIDLERMVLDSVMAEVSIATSLVEAWEAMTDQVDYALLDVNVTNGDTSEIATELIERGVPVMLVTGQRREALPVALRDVPYMRKPADPHRIAELFHTPRV